MRTNIVHGSTSAICTLLSAAIAMFAFGCGGAPTDAPSAAASATVEAPESIILGPIKCVLGYHGDCSTDLVCSGVPPLCHTVQTCSCVPNDPVVVASAQVDPEAIVVDATNAYWIDGSAGKVMSCSKTNCTTPIALASGQTYPWRIAVDGTNVYWTNYADAVGSVMMCAKSGCVAPTVIASGQSYPSGIAVDGTTVYWTSAGAGTVSSCPIAGCSGAPTVLASGQGASQAVAVDGTNVYWTTSSSVRQCTKTGCTAPLTLASGLSNIDFIALDSSNVYWTSFWAPADAGAGGSVARCAIGGCGGSPTTLASGQNGPYALAVRGGNVFWVDVAVGTTNGGTVMTCSTGGCSNQPRTIASGLFRPQGLAADATQLYYTVVGASTVMSIVD